MLTPGERTDVGGLVVEGVGGRHAVIHEDIDRIGNVGVLLRADGEPTVFHPGDAYEYTPTGVDVLAVPVSAPWAALKETAAFVRGVQPGAVVRSTTPSLSPAGRALYVRQLGALGGAEVRDLAGAGSAEMA